MVSQSSQCFLLFFSQISQIVQILNMIKRFTKIFYDRNK
ncbi:hypothetical protein NU08_3389 [Flavobacterium anhuiense]|uniref:Uncharacterized protein n=1 Tax=Flavobacterium anhuiense TaxID=459526 RepID=A0A444VVB1_9FLAO|nr:hypothetical protein NU08_3389 [Flavobacterium anhuiense]